MRRDKYDMVTSDLVRAINKYTCEKCRRVGKKGADGLQMQAAHIVGRRNAGTRYDLNNILCLCSSCHRHFTENPLEFSAWLYEYMGEDKVIEIRAKGWRVHKWKAGEKEELYKEMKRKLAEITG